MKAVYSAIVLSLLSLAACDSPLSPQGADDETLISQLQKLPKEDVTQYPLVAKHLQAHKNYISMTTSPIRLPKVISVLRTLDLSLIDRVLIVLPQKFERDGTEYEIPDIVVNYPKVSIIRIKRDLGPITKLLGTFKVDNVEPESLPIVNEVLSDPENIVITVDDDIAYLPGTVSQLLKASILTGSVAGGSGRNLEFWKLNRNPVASVFGENSPNCTPADLSQCDALEGFAGTAYKVRHMLEREPGKFNAVELMTIGSQYSGKKCFVSDDLVISFVLGKLKIGRAFVPSLSPFVFQYGLLEDALFRGAGSGEKISLNDINADKYHKCLDSLTAQKWPE